MARLVQVAMLLVILVNVIIGAGALLNHRSTSVRIDPLKEEVRNVLEADGDTQLQEARAAVEAAERSLELLRKSTAGGAKPSAEALAATQNALALLREERRGAAAKPVGGRGRAGTEPPPDDVMEKVNLDLSRYPTAVCNDGSPGAYYITEAAPRKGHAAARHVWLIFLQGGGWCWDAASCAARYANERTLMSSESYPPTRNATGIFSPDPELSPFATANKVGMECFPRMHACARAQCAVAAPSGTGSGPV